MPLRVIVSGGGICGLSTAIGLRRAGHKVKVYERRARDADDGAGIVIGRNACAVLRHWGLDLHPMGASVWEEGVFVDGVTLQVRGTIHIDQAAAQAGTHTTTRHDLRQLLTNEALRPAPGQGSIELVFNTPVVDYDAAKPAVQLSDGAWEDADLVIACDGIRSRASRIILGQTHAAKPTGLSAFRLLIPATALLGVVEKYRDDATIADKFNKASVQTWFATEHPGRLFVWWSCRFDTVHAIDAIIPDNERYASSEDWLAHCDKSILLHEFSHWHPVFADILAAADPPQLWKICSREPADAVYKQRLCMLGDALHPMPPFRAQGGTMSIEDAGVLGECFANVNDASEIPARLALFERLRRPRYGVAQLLSALRQDEREMPSRQAEVLESCQKWLNGYDQLQSKDLNSLEAWLHEHDAIQEAIQAVSQDLGANSQK